MNKRLFFYCEAHNRYFDIDYLICKQNIFTVKFKQLFASHSF